MIKLNWLQITAILALTALIILAGCSSPNPDTANVVPEAASPAELVNSSGSGSVAEATAKGDSVNESKEVLDEYLKYSSFDSLQENIFNTNKRIPLTDGSFKTLLEKLKEELEAENTMLTTFFNDCVFLSSNELCSEIDDKFQKKGEWSQTIEIKELIPVEISDSKVIWQVSRRVKSEEQSNFVIVKYELVRVNDKWKITDFIDNTGYSIKSNLQNATGEIDKRIVGKKEYKQSLLNIAQKGKNDKCAYLSFDDKLTVTELQTEKEICYSGKYDSYAKQQKNATICNDIFEPYYRGKCYGQVASEINDLGICDNMTVETYEAKGLNEPASTRDICYVYFGYGKLKASACNKIINVQVKQDCLDYLHTIGGG